ncbi:MAG: hypothetical protein Q8Q13_02700 [bacterium]|nr:hypothetical protein [bacterium]
MAKDYFQDILKPEEKSGSAYGSGKNDIEPRGEPQGGGERSIRNITVNPRAGRRAMSGDMREPPSGASRGPYEKPRLGGQKRIWMWVVAAVSVVVLLILALFAFRDTTVTVTPRSRPVVFDRAVHFNAYPSASAAIGSLSYTVIANDIEDSAVVASEGTVHAEDRASGTITVFNEYSPSPVRLIKNTRFATPAGLVFRVPATVIIPGKKGSVPGSVTVTVVADQAGEQYNVGPVDKFTLPGLKTSPTMYTSVYARSTSAFTGGFVGDRPGVDAGALSAARAEVRARLESKARDGTRALSTAAATVFPDLIRITYQSLPPTTEAGGGVRIHEKAHVEIPVLPADLFAQTVAQGVGENTEGVNFRIEGLDTLVAGYGGGGGAQTLGTDPLDFTLTGNAVLVWKVDAESLSLALAGRDQDAFQGIITGVPSIQEARARIEPFWKGTFPASTSDISIEFVPVQAAQ